MIEEPESQPCRAAVSPGGGTARMEMLRGWGGGGAHPEPGGLGVVVVPPPTLLDPPIKMERSDSLGQFQEKEEKSRIFFLGNPLCKIFSHRGRGKKKKKGTKPTFYLERRGKNEHIFPPFVNKQLSGHPLSCVPMAFLHEQSLGRLLFLCRVPSFTALISHLSVHSLKKLHFMPYIILIVSSLQRFSLQKQTQQQCNGWRCPWRSKDRSWPLQVSIC